MSFFDKIGSAKLVGWAFGSQVVTSGANFVTSVLLVRSLGLDGFGQYSICFISVMIVREFQNRIVLVPMSAISPKLQLCSASDYRGFVLLQAVGFAAVTSAFLWGGAKAGAVVGLEWAAPVAAPLFVANALANMSDFYRRYAFVNKNGVLAFCIDSMRFGVQVGLILLMPATHWGLTVENALWALAAGSAVGVGVGMLSYGRKNLRKRFIRPAWRRHWRFARWLLPSAVITTFQGQLPILVVGALLGDATLGLIRAIQQVANTLNLPINVIIQIAPSQVARALVGGGTQAAKLTVTMFTLSASGCTLVMGGILFGLHGQVIEEWMNINNSSSLLLLIAYIGVSLTLVMRFPFVTMLQAIEAGQGLMVQSIIALGAMLIAVPVLWMLSGVLMPALAQIVANLAGAASALFLLNRKWKQSTK